MQSNFESSSLNWTAYSQDQQAQINELGLVDARYDDGTEDYCCRPDEICWRFVKEWRESD